MKEKRNAAKPAWPLILITIAIVGVAALGILITKQDRIGVSASAEVAGPTTTVRVPIEGMVCAVCAAKVKKSLESVDGVREAEVNLGRREARVRYVEGKFSPEQLLAAINKLGYKAGTPAPEAP